MHVAGARKRIRVGDLLVEAGAITEDQLQQALEKQKEDGGRIGNVIMQMGFISKELLITVLTTQMGIDYCEIRSVQIDESVLNLIPDNLVAKYRAVPVCFDENNPNILNPNNPSLKGLSSCSLTETTPALESKLHFRKRMQSALPKRKPRIRTNLALVKFRATIICLRGLHVY